MSIEWDKLWKEIDIDSINADSNIAWQWVRNILRRVKATGDLLKETIKNGDKQEQAYRDRIDELQPKAERWEVLMELFPPGAKEDVVFEAMKQTLPAGVMIETVKAFVLGRREDIENDTEDLALLLPVLEYFLEVVA